MLYENAFILSGQLSKKSADDFYDILLKKIENSGGKISNPNFGFKRPSLKIKKFKRIHCMINCDCDSKIFKDFDTIIRQDLTLRFFNLKIKSINKDQSLLVEQKGT